MMTALTQRQHSKKIAATKTTTPVVVETMEQRTLMSVSMSTGSSITNITDYSLYAQACMGDNGDPWGFAGISSGTATEETGDAIKQWDSNLDDGLDSGLVNFTFTADRAAGTMSWAVAGADTITYSGSFGTGISQVDLQAAATTAGMAFSFSNVSLSFYSNNTLADTETISSGPAVNTIGAQTSDPAESIARVTPNASNCDKVVITGNIRLQAAQGTYPGATDIFGAIYIHDAA
ncbi:MAG: hypothetical protein ABSH20_29410 [Tepidisphaeraceae bacterium]|jgi:hypothetical protein